ncbi:MAG: hypothetical protein N3E39_02665 [Candidatus Methanomethylicia archaeon]|nr:hypothetical protein [Candidatus Methanomethylicia archaeon]
MSAVFSILSIFFIVIAMVGIKASYEKIDFTSLDFLMAGIICVTMSFFFFHRYKRVVSLISLGLPQAVTLIKCINATCNYKEERFFQEGDYIFKSAGKCPKCNSNIHIEAIYAFETKERK